MENEIIDILEAALKIHNVEISDAYSFLDANLSKNRSFRKKGGYGNTIQYIQVKNFGGVNSRLIFKRRTTGSNFEMTLFKFWRNIKRKNLIPIYNESRAYKRKKLNIK